jgi:TetR/AcrR family transcriptional regulator, transcriptional repressor of bet genes
MRTRTDIRTRRREELRRAAYETAGKHGFQALTVAGIARRAGISKGIVHHYFTGKQDLIEHAVRFAHAQFRRAVLDQLIDASTPSERLWSVVAGNFAPAIFQPPYRRLWLSIFEAARTDPRLARLCAIVDQRTITNVNVALRPLVPASEVDAKAFAIIALMDGCWFLAVDEPQITRSVALNLIASHIRITIPNFDMSAVKLESPSEDGERRKR